MILNTKEPQEYYNLILKDLENGGGNVEQFYEKCSLFWDAAIIYRPISDLINRIEQERNTYEYLVKFTNATLSPENRMTTDELFDTLLSINQDKIKELLRLLDVSLVVYDMLLGAVIRNDIDSFSKIVYDKEVDLTRINVLAAYVRNATKHQQSLDDMPSFSGEIVD